MLRALAFTLIPALVVFAAGALGLRRAQSQCSPNGRAFFAGPASRLGIKSGPREVEEGTAS